MPRPIRKHLPGAFYHITQRGNARKRLFFSDEDRFRFCMLLQEGVERFGHRIHAFCLMDNHIHLLAQAGADPISKAMHNLTFRYAKYLNKKFGANGHQFQGRYFSGFIGSDEYLLEALKYVHLNPVKANMVSKPADYYWSTHCYYSDIDNIHWVERDYCLGLFHDDFNRSVREYDLYMDQPQDELVNQKLTGSCCEFLIGDDNFIERMELLDDKHVRLQYVSIQMVIEVVCDTLCVDFALVGSDSRKHNAAFIRGIIGYLIINHTEETIASFARTIGKSQSTLSRSIKKVTERVKYDTKLQQDINDILVILEVLNANLHA